MDDDPDIPDPRFLEGVNHFNAGEFFEAHEVWEDLWMECPAAERRFVQALIQAAVAVYHLARQLRGARRLFHSGRRYMEPYRPAYMGLDVADFWGEWRRTSPGTGRPREPGRTAAGDRPRLATPRLAMTDEATILENFDGIARLFPLPNLVMFPGVVQGLHVFESRYRQMTAEALASDSLIALVMLKPGWEDDYEERPPIEAVACLGHIGWHEQLPDGRYNLRLRGLARVRIIEELPGELPYRTARVEVISDTGPTDPTELKRLRHELAETVLPRFEEEARGGNFRSCSTANSPWGRLRRAGLRAPCPRR